MPDMNDSRNWSIEGTWEQALGLVWDEVTPEVVHAHVDIDRRHHQPYGIVHGGVHAGIIETVCSLGAALWALPQGLSVVGLENSTSFLRAVRSGRLRVTAKPLTRGRRSQVWEAEVRDVDQRLVAHGKVRLMCLEPGTAVAGREVSAAIDKP